MEVCIQGDTQASDLWYHVKGEGHTVILLHGAGASSNQFSFLFKRLSTKKLRIVAIDFRGHGLSGEGDGFTARSMAHDIQKVQRSITRTSTLTTATTPPFINHWHVHEHSYLTVVAPGNGPRRRRAWLHVGRLRAGGLRSAGVAHLLQQGQGQERDWDGIDQHIRADPDQLDACHLPGCTLLPGL